MLDPRPRVTGLTIGILCGIGIVLFLASGTIVVSLIPTYLSRHDSSVNFVGAQSQVFYLEYSTTVGDGTINYATFLTNLASATQQLNAQLGLSSKVINIQKIQLVQQTNSGRRRRDIRNKRAFSYLMLLSCETNYPLVCHSTVCQQRILDTIRQQCSNHPNINLQLSSPSVAGQTAQFDLKFVAFSVTIPSDFAATTTQTTTVTASPTNVQLIQNCIGQNINKQPVIIDTDTDIDDLWAILYLLNVPTVDIVAITTVGDGFSAPLYSSTNVLSLLGLVGCTDGIAVASGLSVPSLPSGLTLAASLLSGIDTYLTSSTCLNQSTNIFLQPSPFEAVELMIYTLKYSQRPVDILSLGPLTNIAAAITRDRSIVSKIGTVYISGGQFSTLSSYSTLIPNPNLGIYPYSAKTSGSSSNVFLDVLAVQRVDDSGIQKLVAMPSPIQKQLPTNLTQVNLKLKSLNVTLTPFIYGLITSLAKCTSQTESSIYWWDNSAAQLMVQIQNNITNGFCTTLQNVQSLYILSADGDQLFGQGLIDFQKTRPNTQGLSNYTICTQTNSDIFLTEFLTKISSNKLSSCETIYQNRFDIKLQSCLATYGYN